MVVVSSCTGGEEEVCGILYPPKLGMFLSISQQSVILSTNGDQNEV
jgi:hypothetical protein